MPTAFTWIGGTNSSWATAANWSPSGPPSATGDTAIFDQNAVGPLAGSDQSTTTLAHLIITSAMAQAVTIGTKGTPLKINATMVRIGEPSQSSASADGSQRINLDLATGLTASTGPCTVDVFSTASQSADANQEPVRIKCNNAAAIISVLGGLVGINTDQVTDTTTLASVYVTIGGTVNLGNSLGGVTAGSVVNNGGTVTLSDVFPTSGVQTLGGTTTTKGTGSLTVTAQGGTTILNHRSSSPGSTASIDTLNLHGGDIDTSQDGRQIKATAYSLRTGNINSFSGDDQWVNLPLNFNGATKISISTGV